MSKVIGIVACSAEGAALCYRTICLEAARIMGPHLHPEIGMHTFALGQYMEFVRANNWPGVAGLMAQSGKKLAEAGAEFLICPDNTIHQAFIDGNLVGPLPWLSISEVVAREAVNRGFEKIGVLGTKYLMEGPVYSMACAEFGLEMRIPEKTGREEVDRIIFSELVYGRFTRESRRYFNNLIERFKEEGCEAVVLGCTEIPLLVDPDDCPLPCLDSTRLLAGAALKMALERDDP